MGQKPRTLRNAQTPQGRGWTEVDLDKQIWIIADPAGAGDGPDWGLPLCLMGQKTPQGREWTRRVEVIGDGHRADPAGAGMDLRTDLCYPR